MNCNADMAFRDRTTSCFLCVVPLALFLCWFSFYGICLVDANPSKIVAKAACPCSDPSLCEPITTTPEKEILAFSEGGPNWKQYPWDNLTTVITFGQYDPEVMCYAHSKGVRLIPGGSFPSSLLTNDTERNIWINQTLTAVIEHHMDGFNLDIEYPVNKSEAPLLTSMVEQTTSAFRKALPHSKITFDTPCQPGCLYGRCYDYKAIADIVDYLMIMAYDELNQNGTAQANAPFNTTATGINEFIQLGIPANKLVLGVPWYGYYFPCDNLTESNVCTGKPDSGREINYSDIMVLLEYYSTSGRLWSESSMSPYFNYKDISTGEMYQMWYDDPMSSTLRYNLAKEKGLYGVGIWTADKLDYREDPITQKQTQAMWDAFLSFAYPWFLTPLT